MVRLFKKFITLAKSFQKPRQTTWVYCPGCKVDLVSSPDREIIEDGYYYVHYHCGICHFYSVWDFSFPAPILINSHYMNYSDWKTGYWNDSTEAG